MPPRPLGPRPRGIRSVAHDAADAAAVRTEDARRLGVGLLATEFGSVSSTVDGLRELEIVTSDADASSPPVSWFYWADADFFDPLKLRTLGRPFEQLCHPSPEF